MIKLTNDKAAAVNQQLYWIPISYQAPPRGARLLLINQALGVAQIGPYTPDAGWTHWQGLPKFLKDD